MTHITCRLTAENLAQLRNPTLGSRVWATFIFLGRHFQILGSVDYRNRKQRDGDEIGHSENNHQVTHCVWKDRSDRSEVKVLDDFDHRALYTDND